MDKVYNLFLRFVLNMANNMTGRFMPQVDELAKNNEPLKEIKERVSKATQLLYIIIFVVVFGLIVYATKQLFYLLTKKRKK